MQIESIEISNFRVFKDAHVRDLKNMAVFLGVNGSGKSTFFDIFGFLHDCLNAGVKKALMKRGGFDEVASRESEGPIKFTLKFRPSDTEPLVTYVLSIGLDGKDPIVEKEILRLRRGSKGSPWKILDFSRGVGFAIQGDISTYEDVRNTSTRSKQKLMSPDMLAVDSLGQLQEFEAVAALRRLIEDWYVSDFRIDLARERQEITDGTQLNQSGDNLSAATMQLKEDYPEAFESVIQKMRERIPGVKNVEAIQGEGGYFLLRFDSDRFINPFSAKYVSDGTIKMFAYLLLLADPHPHTLLCVEEPENQLYPNMLMVLAEEFREYANKGGQVFISTHSPDFLNAVEINELYCIIKKDGYSEIVKASDMPLVRDLYYEGDKLGWLWNQEILPQIPKSEVL